MRIADLIGGIVVLLLGLAVVLYSWQLPYMSEYGPGPGFLPLWVGFGIVGCAIAVIAKILKKKEERGAFSKPQTKLGVRVLVLMVITFLLFPILGFSIALGLFVGASMRAMGKHHWIPCGLTAVITAICIHFIFGHWLDIPLPTGFTGW